MQQKPNKWTQTITCFALLLVIGTSTTATGQGTLTPDVRIDSTTNERVGQTGPNRYVTPVNQILTPTGTQVRLPGMRPQALALSPDGRLLVTAGKTSELVVLNPLTGGILQRVALPAEKQTKAVKATSSHLLKPDTSGQLSFTGLVFSPDGTKIYLSNVNGSIKVFGVDANLSVSGLFTIALPPANAPDREAAIPTGLALSEDGKRIFVALNLSNRLAEIEVATGKVLRLWDVGVAPYEVVLVGNKAYVSNWGGRRPWANSLTGPAGRGTFVRVDPIRHIDSEGSVSVIELSSKARQPNPNYPPKFSSACIPRRWYSPPTEGIWSSPAREATTSA